MVLEQYLVILFIFSKCLLSSLRCSIANPVTLTTFLTISAKNESDLLFFFLFQLTICLLGGAGEPAKLHSALLLQSTSFIGHCEVKS